MIEKSINFNKYFNFQIFELKLSHKTKFNSKCKKDNDITTFDD